MNPWNFFVSNFIDLLNFQFYFDCLQVQPYEDTKKLEKLMMALQEKYKDVLYSPLQIGDVQQGKIYASKHVDGIWYRWARIYLKKWGYVVNVSHFQDERNKSDQCQFDFGVLLRFRILRYSKSAATGTFGSRIYGIAVPSDSRKVGGDKTQTDEMDNGRLHVFPEFSL